MFADSHYLLNAQNLGSITTATIDPFCHVASIGSPSHETPSQAGRSGHDFIIMLSGPKTVYGDAIYNRDGIYSVTYDTPEVGDYVLSARSAQIGGLNAAYFRNRWLFGDPVNERIDKADDF